jgi:hypothetical protein
MMMACVVDPGVLELEVGAVEWTVSAMAMAGAEALLS